MQIRKRTALAAAIAMGLGFGAMGVAEAQQTTLRIFTGGQQRPDVMRQIVDVYQQRNPGVRVVVEVGGATSEAQQQYLSTVLSSRDPVLDVILIDVIRPAQWAATGWAEPLDAYIGADREALFKRYLPAYAQANVVDGKVIALPYFADSQFLYYRKDLLDKHGMQPPKTWDELRRQAVEVMRRENNPNLRGFLTAGAPIEGTVCTYLVPMWGAGGDLIGANRAPQVTSAASRRSFDLWQQMKNDRVLPPNIAEIVTDGMRREFQAGNGIFTMQWGYAWNLFQGGDSNVKDKVAVVPLPGFVADRPATCIGGWQVAVSAFSRNKAEAAKLVQYLSSPEVSKAQAILASHLPVFPEIYVDPDVTRVNPWFADARAVVMTARSRPVTPNYPEVSDIIRSNMNAFLAGTKTADVAIQDMQTRLTRALR